MTPGLYLKAPLPRAGWWRRTPSNDRIFGQIEAVGDAFAGAAGFPFEGWYESCRELADLRLSLVPFETPGTCFIRDGVITLFAPTAGGGPGYHAYVSELADEIAKALGLTWETPAPDRYAPIHYVDYGFFESRDRSVLVQGMCEHLQTIAHQLLDIKDHDRQTARLGLPDSLVPKGGAFAASCLGEWPRSWFERIADATDGRLRSLAAPFFPWWDDGLSAENLRSFGLALCWTKVRWVEPKSPQETALYQLILECFERAKTLAPNLELPRDEAIEIYRLLNGQGVVDEPSPHGLGFLRRTVSQPLSGGWMLDLEGYFENVSDVGREESVFRFGDRTVTASATLLPGSQSEPDEVLRDLVGELDLIPLETTHPHLAAACENSIDESGAQCLRAHLATREGFCQITLSYLTEEHHRWAWNVAQSVTPPTVST